MVIGDTESCQSGPTSASGLAQESVSYCTHSPNLGTMVAVICDSAATPPIHPRGVNGTGK